jgi:hypothetical protein
MSARRRELKRPLGERRYKKLFIIVTEGVKTEPRYFALFNDRKSIIKVKCLKGKSESSPPQVLRRMTKYLRQESLMKSDEAWLVVDKDQWTDEQLERLLRWEQGSDNYGFALSNPKFEYWLLLHFEDGEGISSSRACSERLKRYLPNYDKDIDSGKIIQGMIAKAIQRAKQRDNPPCTDWPRGIGSTVYRLVERILS